MEVQDLNRQPRNDYLISCKARLEVLEGSKFFFTISSQILTLPMEAVLFKTAPLSDKFYGALEPQVRDQIQHKHFCDHVTRLITDTIRKDTLEWTTESRSYTSTERNFALPVYNK